MDELIARLATPKSPIHIMRALREREDFGMTTTSISPYAKFSAALLAETLVQNRQHELEEVLARYLQFNGMTSAYDLRNDMLWGAGAMADFVGTNRKRMFNWIETGRFPHTKLGAGGVSARKTIVLCHIFTQELASLKGISLREYTTAEGKNPPLIGEAASKPRLVLGT